METSEPVDTRSQATARAIADALSAEMGKTGFLKANPKIVLSVGESSFIIRVNRGSQDDLVLASAFVKNISGRPLSLYTVGVSGTIRKLLDTARSLHILQQNWP